MVSHPFLIPILIYISPKNASTWQHIPHGWPLPWAPDNRSRLHVLELVPELHPRISGHPVQYGREHAPALNGQSSGRSEASILFANAKVLKLVSVKDAVPPDMWGQIAS